MTLVEFINKNHPSVGIAKLIFNFLGEKYPKIALSKVIDSSSGGTPNRGISNYYGGEIPWLKSGEITDGLVTEFSETITEEGMKNSSAKLFSKGTLLVAMYGATAGKTGILDFDSTTNQALCAIFPKEDILRDYLFWYFRQARVDFIEISKGGAQPNISQTVIGRALIPFPNLETQRQVIDFLTEIEQKDIVKDNFIFPEIYSQINQLFSYRKSYSTLQTENQTQAKLLTKLRKAYLQEAVMGQLTADWREQNPTQDTGKALLTEIKKHKAQLIKEGKLRKEKPLNPIKPEEIPFEIPDNWTWCRLGGIVSIVSGNNFESSSFGKKEGIRVIKITNAGVGELIETDDFLPQTFKEKYPNFLVYSGELLIALTPYIADGLKICICPDLYNESLLNQRVALLRTNRSKEETLYIYHFLRTDFILNLFKSKYGGKSQQPNLKIEDISLLLIPLPPLTEQQAIVSKIEGLLAQVEGLEKENKAQQEYAQRLMGAVLQEAFGG